MTQPTRRRYELICEASPDAILLVDTDGQITYANARVDDMLGYDPDELLGDPIETLVPEDERAGHVEKRDAFIADPETRPMGVNLDLTARRADGSTVPVDISLSPIPVDDEVGVMAAVRDVSERTELKRKYQTILEAVPDPVLIADAETGELVEANTQVGALLGYDPDDLEGKPQSIVHPSGEDERYRELFERHVGEERAIFTEFEDGSDIYVETRRGSKIPVEINARVFELGDRTLVAGVFRDVSARKQRETQLRELHETTRRLMACQRDEEVARVVVDAANSILEYSSTVIRFATDDALESAEVTDQARVDLGPRPTYPLAGDNPVSRAYATQEPAQFDDVRTIDDDYDRGAARAAMYLPLGEHGVLSIVDAAVGAFDQSDVELASILTANAEAALDRLAHERALERQNRRLDEFASVVSHDLRNPLGVAQGWLDAVKEDDDREELDRIEDALDRMDAIIDGTLTLAKQGETVVEDEEVDLSALARESWRGVSTGDGTLKIDEEIRLRCDRARLRQVLENLFRNAVEHGGDDVTVTISRLDDGFAVSDDGPGIPTAECERVFEPGETSAPDGTGFGLAIVRDIAEAHGWDVCVTDGPAGGACFEFTGVDVS